MTKETTNQRTLSIKVMVSTAMLIAICVIMFSTPIGTIRLPLISVTIAHIPVLIATLLFGFKSGLIVGTAFGLTSMIVALTMAVSPFDLLFVNPLISVFPRVLIPITTYFSYHLIKKFTKNSAGTAIAVSASALIGNLTNTFAVYIMIYLLYAQHLLEVTGVSAFNLIITAISTTTLIKSVIIVLITTPVVMTLKKVLNT